MPTTTVRQDLRSGLYAAGVAFKAANPTLLLRTYHRRPPGFTGDLPALYIGSLNELIEHDAGTRGRTFDAQVVLVCKPTGSGEEVADEIDTLTDTFLDYLTLNPRAAGAGYLIEPTATRDIEIELDDTVYPSVVISVRCRALEGRSRTGA